MGMDYQLKHKIWVIAGAESSGKTTLFESLKTALPKHQFVSEYNRDWLTQRSLAAPFSFDVLNRLFSDCLEYYMRLAPSQPTIMDTDLLNLWLWASHVQHPLRFELKKQWEETQFCYLLCPPNIPYEFDSLRSGELVQQWSWEAHVHELKKRHCVVLEHNDASERLAVALKTILLIE